MSVLKIMFNPKSLDEEKLGDSYWFNTIIITSGIVFPLFTYFELWNM